MMVTVLRRLGGSGLVEEHPNLAAYRRAFADQLAVFTASSGGGSSAGAGGATPA
jgi:glutathione S-transferase